MVLLTEQTCLPYDFIGTEDSFRHGLLRVPRDPVPDNILRLDEGDAGKIRNYREPYARNQGVAFLFVCMSTSGAIQGKFVSLLYLIIAHTRRSTASPIWTTTPRTARSPPLGVPHPALCRVRQASGQPSSFSSRPV